MINWFLTLLKKLWLIFILFFSVDWVIQKQVDLYVKCLMHVIWRCCLFIVSYIVHPVALCFVVCECFYLLLKMLQLVVWAVFSLNLSYKKKMVWDFIDARSVVCWVQFSSRTSNLDPSLWKWQELKCNNFRIQYLCCILFSLFGLR